ncbi:MAG: hypothetical protein HC934_14330 [Acaryochloridaceae cyanobacterium SU_2_1]|nr:hypothetical protein [Acaryochloridaceae cyanobacterium SU_2_1]
MLGGSNNNFIRLALVPHGHSFHWQSNLIWLDVTSDTCGGLPMALEASGNESSDWDIAITKTIFERHQRQEMLGCAVGELPWYWRIWGNLIHPQD